jgi:predicted ATPase/DNA-binding SARP family transcriptional activator
MGREWLAETLWPDCSTSEALALMRRELTDLRRALGPAAEVLRSPTPRTLCMDLTGAFVDAVAFDQALDRGDVSSLHEAVSLYRGPLLEGWHEEWEFEERLRREQAYLNALETLVGHARAGGDRQEAAQYLRRIVVVEPLRESAHRLLMQLLAEGGNYAAALRTYRDLRLLLHRELNAAPDPETTALFQQIRAETRHRAGSAPDARAPDPRRSASLSPAEASSGWLAPDPPEEPAVSLPRQHLVPHLPLPLTRFIGREKEMAAVKQWLVVRRLVTLAGAAGCGKTRLALQVAADLVEEFTDGVWLIELAALVDPELVPQTVAAALGVRELPQRALIESLVDFLREKLMLLVLDNCEHLRAACAQLADALLRTCADLSIMATSREKLGIDGEQTYPVSPFAVPDPDHLPSLDQLREFEAVQLFSDRAALSQPDFLVTGANAAAVARVCQRLDGIPLAIELAAARVMALSVEQIAAWLDEMFRLLTGGSRAAMPRHQTLRASIDWSYALLSEPERQLLRCLSVFAGGWTLEAAETVGSGQWTVDSKVNDAELDAAGSAALPGPTSWAHSHRPLPANVLDSLTQLVGKSLVVYEKRDETRAPGEGALSRPAPGRDRLLEMVRQYARDRLLRSGEEETVRQRHLQFYLGFAERGESELRGPRQGEWVDRLAAEHGNLRAALDWAAKSHEAALGLRLAGALTRFWEIRGHLKEGRERLAGMLALPATEAATVPRARALNAAARLAEGQGDYAVMRSRVGEALELWRLLGEQRGIGISLRQLGDLADFAGDYASARRYREESLAIFRSLGDEREVMASLANLGLTPALEREYRAAHPFLEEALHGYQKLGDQLGTSYALNNLGIVALGLGDYPAARALFRQSLVLKRQLGNRGGICWGLAGLAQVAAAQGQAQKAARLFAAADTERKTIGMDFPPDFEHGVAMARSALGDSAFASAWAKGGAMSLAEAIADALRDDPGIEPAP